MLKAARMMRDSRQLRAVTGVDRQEFNIILSVFEKVLHEFFKNRPRERAVGAGRKGVLETCADKLIFILLYVKAYPTCDVASFIFGAHRTRCCQWVLQLLPLLEKALGRVTVLPKRRITTVEEFLAAFPEVKDLFIDGTERPVRRSKTYYKQTRNYSGKKNRHTRKNIVVCDEKSRILLVSPTDGGRCHDLTSFKKWAISTHIPKEVGIWVDKGFTGLRAACDNKVMMPHKKPPKGSVPRQLS